MCVIEQYETCFSTNSKNVLFDDRKLTAITLDLFCTEEQFGALAILNDEYLDNAKRFPFQSGQQMLVSSTIQFAIDHRKHIHAASFKSGHFSVFYFPKDMGRLWGVLTGKGIIAYRTGIRFGEGDPEELPGNEGKVSRVETLPEARKYGWLSFSHDAQYVLRRLPSI